MIRSKFSLFALASLVAALFLACSSYIGQWFERGSGYASGTWRRTVDLYDRFCFKVEAVAVNALRMFGPTGVFALALTSLDSSVKTARKAWASLMHREGHYHAPGGWTRCAST